MPEKMAQRFLDASANFRTRKSVGDPRNTKVSLVKRGETGNFEMFARKDSIFVQDNETRIFQGGNGGRKKTINTQNLKQFKESRIARRMLYLTNKRLMSLLLIMLIILQIFSKYFWIDNAPAYKYDTTFAKIAYQGNMNDFSTAIPTILSRYYEKYDMKLINVTIPGYLQVDFRNGTNLRYEEIRQFTGTIENRGATILSVSEFVSARYSVQIQALLYLIQIGLIMILFMYGMYQFNVDAREKILNNLERMLEKIRKMAENPASALTLDSSSQGSKSDLLIIEQTIQKIAFMLVLGFGEAGNTLLSRILWTKKWDMDFLSQPNNIFGIFGFCDIRNFTDATETLREDVLQFVNTVADIVHNEVSNHKGGANKNIGDAFLVVWKLKGEKVSDIKELCSPDLFDLEERDRILKTREQAFMATNVSSEGGVNSDMVFFNNNMSNSNVAEFSLISFLKIIARILTEPKIEVYNRNQKLLKAVPNFRVKLGFGLHAGWAIEGAIGSYFKIDMSYLSPHVDMAAKLEGYTKFYGVSLLFTHCLYNLFVTKKFINLCRRLDRVSSKGADEPYDLYTIDFNVERLDKEKDTFEMEPQEKHNVISNIKSFKDIKLKNITQSTIMMERIKEENDSDSYWNDDTPLNSQDYVPYEDIEQMFEYISMDQKVMKLLELDLSQEQIAQKERFNRAHKEALDLYIDGYWKESGEKFEKIFEEFPPDSASKAIYNFMKETNFVPENWKRFRED